MQKSEARTGERTINERFMLHIEKEAGKENIKN